MVDEIKKKIAVVEDDTFYRNIYKNKLVKEGYEVSVYENGKVALGAIDNNIPDLIVLDLVMPVMDGFQFLENLRKENKLKDIKVIVMSNLGQDEDVEKARSMGAIEFLIKTNLSLQEMVDTIKKHL